MTDRGPTQECAHCWHDYGFQSGGTNGLETTMSGTRMCCQCGATDRYDYRFRVVAPQHGPFYDAILRAQW